ncbi:class I poly(R)-hydroxyalkanoic acid synthase [Variovorax saccharolyticus]|uniref:class I poly(R)-hydroxyalkanoic acid synthase n=1 Tax=Variovorax saccharolyticus TaxID=3053516 RepID=UPI002576D748|nr:class I poly(R)-hydroxyalkanoic acid synthase [Variovorax sp. J22R187]MDM0021503.1 class I poly(R)-hydroxyalkanoic acid synthase [Variovorax sp. J22R187]
MSSPFNMPDEFVRGFVESGGRLFGAGGGAAVDAAQFAQAQAHYWQQQAALWTGWLASGGTQSAAVVDAERGDRRFQGDAWSGQPWFSLLKQNYLLNARLLGELADAAELEAADKHKLRFFMRQFIDSMSPANFAGTNPEVLKLALESNGQSVAAGLAHLVDDLGKGRISITDESAFEIGRNVAVSKGSVVYENPLMQLIQYAPLTEKVAVRPLLIVPPCINKFYILDLQPENSFVRFACEQGQTVFLVSWRNPGPDLGHVTWDDYLVLGAMAAIEVALAISGADKLNAVGWCVGGTILASALAVLRAQGDRSVASATFLTTMLDFAEPGDLGVFVDAQGVAQREATIGRGGIYAGAELGFVFQSLRANDLIWPYVIGNYLKGKSPAAFDLLYWNADATNLPGPMYAWYLRNMYLENNLRVPDRLTMCETAVDLGRIDMPCYVLATREDHIVPWRSAYQTTQLVGGKSQFVLGASGHIAGVVNPASKDKRSYWTGAAQGESADAWLAGAQETPGSWWKHWRQWLKPLEGKQVVARQRLGNAEHAPIEDAPGRYVKQRAE